MKVWIADRLRRILAAAVGQMEPARAECSVCGRPLYAASSIIRGMGATCAGRHARKDVHTLDMFEAGTPGSEHGCG